MRESADRKAERLLIEHRLNVLWRDRWQLIAEVRGDSGVEHDVRWSSGAGWTCNCTASSYRSTCSHVRAAQHVVATNRSLTGGTL